MVPMAYECKLLFALVVAVSIIQIFLAGWYELKVAREKDVAWCKAFKERRELEARLLACEQELFSAKHLRTSAEMELSRKNIELLCKVSDVTRELGWVHSDLGWYKARLQEIDKHRPTRLDEAADTGNVLAFVRPSQPRRFSTSRFSLQ
jgi:hypothetical protein